MNEHGVLFTAPMVQAIQKGNKTQTRRVCKADVPEHVKDFCSYYHPKPGHWLYGWDDTEKCLLDWAAKSPYGGPGDRIWVRETFFAWGRWETRFSAKKGRDEWHFIDMTTETGNSYLYAADGVRNTQAFIKRRGGVLPMYWQRPAIFMPRVASRITRELSGIRVERLNDITEADARAEGVYSVEHFWRDTEYPLPNVAYMPMPGWHTKYSSAVAAYEALWEHINGPGSWSANPWVWVNEFKPTTKEQP